MPRPMTITREFDATRINIVLNHADVRPFVADMAEGYIDMSKQVANNNNVLLMGEHGGCFFYQIMDGLYEVHTQILPAGRGAWTKGFLLAVRNYIYTQTNAIEVLTRIPGGNKGARLAAESVGMKLEFTREDGVTFNGEIMPVDVYSERLQDWVTMDPYIVQDGEKLHQDMAREAVRVGITEQPHEDDENHNRYVGACVQMMRGGQYGKAVAFYNRWAILARHAQISLVSITPPTVKFDVGLLKFTNTGLEIIPCV